MQQDTITRQARIVEEAFTDFYVAMMEQLPGIAFGLLIIILGILIASWIGNFAMRRLSHRTKDPLMSRFLGKSIRFVLIVIAIMLGLDAAGFGGIAAGILTAAGASALIFGFAFKDIGENFIAGIILAFSRPFNIGDTVEVDQVFGKVLTMEFRYTKLKTFDGKDVYIPNSDVLRKPVTNYTEDGFFRWTFTVGIAYENDIEGAKQLIQKVLDEEPSVIEDKEHRNFIVEDELATSTVNLKVFFWLHTKDFRRVSSLAKGRVIKAVKETLEQNGYYLPADIQELKLYGGEKDFPVRLTGNADSAKTV